MKAAALPADEAARLALLGALDLLNAGTDDAPLERLARLAATLLRMPVGMVNLIDEQRQWMRARHGIDVREIPRELAFCPHALYQRELLVVPDARQDARFADNPLVSEEPHLRFYAGMPLFSSEGVALGALCVVDWQAREFTPQDEAVLRDLAALAQRELVHRELLLKGQGARLFRLAVPDDGGTARFDWICPALAAMAGTTPQALQQDAAPFLTRVHPDDRRALRALLREPTMAVGSAARVLFRFSEVSSQRVGWYEAHVRTSRPREGVTVWGGYLADISGQVDAQRRKREDERLWTATVLATGVGHEFNNLVGGMSGLAELCRDQAEPGTRMHHNLQAIMDGGAKAAALIRKLLDFARQSDLVFQPLSLGSMVAEGMPLLQAALPPGVGLALATEPGQDEPVAADRAQLAQALQHLVDNAGLAMRVVGGTVRLGVAAFAAEHSPLHVRSMRLRVADTGCGIAPQNLRRVFQPFFTTRAVGEGSGLGLSSAYGIVTSHGGVIEVHSVEGEGSQLDLWLPCLPAGTSAPPPT